MNTLPKRFILPLGLALGGLVVGYFIAGWLSGGGAAPPGADTAANPAQAEAQLYTCSMHPQVRSTDPDAKCPLCGMDLIPVPTGAGGEEGADLPRLSVSPRAAALMQLDVQRAERRGVMVPVPLFGMLESDETQLRTISAWVPGRIDWLYVDATGVRVEAGQPIARVFSPKLIAAQEELLHAIRAERDIAPDGLEVIRESARLTVEAARDRLRLLGLDHRQVQDLEERGYVEDHVALPAPVSGIVLERLVAVGDYVDTGEPIYRLADLGRLWAQLEVYETDLRRLRPGQRAWFSTPSYPGEEFSGEVTFIDPVVDPRKRTAQVRVEVDNPGGRLKPGMFVRGRVEGGAIAAAAGPEEAAPVVIPASAPLLTGKRAVVYVQLPEADEPTYEAREVVLGPRAGEWYPVEAGLAEGELVVVNGAFKLDAELQIRGRPSMMQGLGGQAAGESASAGASGHHDHEGHTGHDVAPMDMSAAAPETFRLGLGRLVKAQFGLVEALAGDDADAARRAALAVDQALHDVPGADLQGATARARWNELAATMHEGLGALGRAPGLDRQRSAFERFSDALTGAVQGFGVSGAGTVYRAICPMVQGRDGYWLTDREEIANPYHGASMLRCGWIAETLADAQSAEERAP